MEITRVRDKILDAVHDETDFATVAHASLLVWAGILRLDGEITREHARNVANQVINHFILPRGN
jgi:hypothetical protein